MDKTEQEFMRLDHAARLVAPVLNPDTREQFTDAMFQAGSIDNMPEPFKSWLINPLSVPKDAM